MECRACHQSKAADEFKKHLGGRDTICKACYRIRNRAYTKAYTQRPKGWAKRAWRALCARAGNHDGRHPAYTHVEVRMSKDEFLGWAIPRYEKWLLEHEVTEAPTIDRIESRGHYELKNIQLLSRSDNSAKAAHSARLATADSLVRFIIRHATKLGISPESVAELIVKEQGSLTSRKQKNLAPVGEG